MRILFLNLFLIIAAFSTFASPSYAEGDAASTTEGTDGVDPVQVVNLGIGESQDFKDNMEAHIIAVFQWQLRTSERILMMVMFLTSAGVLFAGYQLWHAMHPRPVNIVKAEADADAPTVPETTSSVSFGDGKFEVTSPIVGILILMIALGSLYFFLTFVYSIDVMPLT